MSEDKIIFKAPHSGIYRVDNGKVNLEVRVAADCQECFNLAHDLLKQREENEKLKAQLERAEDVIDFYSDSDNWEHKSPAQADYVVILDDSGTGEFQLNHMTDDDRVGGRRGREYFKEKELE